MACRARARSSLVLYEQTGEREPILETRGVEARGKRVCLTRISENFQCKEEPCRLPMLFCDTNPRHFCPSRTGPCGGLIEWFVALVPGTDEEYL